MRSAADSGMTPNMATHSSLLAFGTKGYMRVLIAIDSSESSQTVVNELAAQPWPERSEFCVINVFDPLPFSKAPAMIPEIMKAAQGLVEAAAGQLSAAGKKVSVSVLQGHPASSIIDAAEKWNADFVVIGSHGLGRLQRFFLGGTARIVVREAPCSVEIVRALPGGAKAYGRQGMRIPLATDGSRYSMAAVRSVVERPWPAGSEVKVLSAAEPVMAVTEAVYSNPEVTEKLLERSVEEAKEAVAEALTILNESQLKAAGSVPEALGGPKLAVLDEAKKWGAHLIVVGSHGRRGLERLLLGSVSEAVAMHAHCSVDVIRLRQNPKKKGERQ